MNDTLLPYVMALIALVLGVIIVVLQLRMRRKLPNLKKGQVQFHVNYASGYSNKSFLTKAGGASGVLRISIVDNVLHFWMSPAFAFFGSFYDLLHAIPVANIRAVNTENGRITVTFHSNAGSNEFVIRSMKRKEAFLAVLENLRK